MTDIDYAVTGTALFLGTALAALVVFFRLVLTGRLPRATTVVATAAACTAAIIGVVEAAVPH